MAPPFKHPPVTKDKLILVANVQAKKGQGPELQKYIKACRTSAYSDDEPLTFTYRTSVSAEGDADKFIIFEEYQGADGLEEHVSKKAFQDLGGSGLIESLEINYYYEFE